MHESKKKQLINSFKKAAKDKEIIKMENEGLEDFVDQLDNIEYKTPRKQQEQIWMNQEIMKKAYTSTRLSNFADEFKDALLFSWCAKAGQ